MTACLYYTKFPRNVQYITNFIWKISPRRHEEHEEYSNRERRGFLTTDTSIKRRGTSFTVFTDLLPREGAKCTKKWQKNALCNRRGIRLIQQAQCKQAQDKLFVSSLRIATILYKYMHIYLWTSLIIVVFERGLWATESTEVTERIAAKRHIRASLLYSYAGQEMHKKEQKMTKIVLY